MPADDVDRATDRIRSAPDAIADVARLVTDLLELIRQRTGFPLVMVTRKLGADWQVVQVSDNPFGIQGGDTLRWSDSVCSRMVASGEPGPWLIDDLDAVDAGDAAVRRLHPIRAYAGVPLVDSGGALLGTLCAIDPEGRPVGDADLFGFAESFASWALDRAEQTASTDRAAERRLLPTVGRAALVPAEAWARVLETEATRTRWSGETLSVALIRVTGTQRDRHSGQALAQALGPRLDEADAVTVLGSNRVGIVSVGRTAAALGAILDQVAVPPADAEPALAWVVSEIAGSEAVAELIATLELELVGGAAAARAASRLITYRFCDSCGMKGVYVRPGTDMSRCKYCRELASPSGG